MGLNKLFGIFNDIRMKGKEGRKYRLYALVSLILFLVSLSVVYDARGFLEERLMESKIVKIPLCSVETHSNLDDLYIQENVPDYDAEINTEVPKEILLENKLYFDLSILDTGIVKFDKPYYIILLIDPDQKIRAMFPYFYTSRYSDEPDCPSFSTYNFPKKWSYTDYQKQTFYVPSENSEKHYELTRNQLLGNSTDFILRYFYNNIDKEGDWGVRVFLFDENYQPRGGSSYRLDKYAIKIETVKFRVVHEFSDKKRNVLVEILGVVGTVSILAGTFFFGVYKLLKKYGDKIEEHLKENKYAYLVVLTICILTLILAYFLCRKC